MRSTFFLLFSAALLVWFAMGLRQVGPGKSKVQHEVAGRESALVQDPRLFHLWREADIAEGVSVNITPNVVFIFSSDESHILEIDVTQYDLESNHGQLTGIVRFYRDYSQDLRDKQRHVKITYELSGDSLVLTFASPPDWISESRGGRITLAKVANLGEAVAE